MTRKRIPRIDKTCPQCAGVFQVAAWGHYTLTEKQHCSKKCALDSIRVTPENRAERFWAQVHKGERCWVWKGAKHRYGYGACSDAFGDTRAHRVAWVITHGPIPDGKVLCHKCDTKLCVNPAHIYVGTQADNMLDRAKKFEIGTLKPNDIREIRKLLPSLPATEIAVLFKVTPGVIYGISSGRNYGHVS